MNLIADWLKVWDNIPELCKYNLSCVGAADEHHMGFPNWKSHLEEISQQRINITNICNIKHNEPESLSSFINEHRKEISEINNSNFKVYIYSQHWWRRGTDIQIFEITINNKIISTDLIFPHTDTNNDEWKWADYISLFIINPKIIDTREEDDWISDCCN
jgi:hypothetical protein